MLVSQLTHVPIADREAMREGQRDSATHLRLAAAIPALGQIEIGGKASRECAGETLTVVAWNVERLRHGDAIAATLAGQAPEIVLLSEVDEGISSGRPSLRALADRLGMPSPMASSSSSSAAAARRALARAQPNGGPMAMRSPAPPLCLSFRCARRGRRLVPAGARQPRIGDAGDPVAKVLIATQGDGGLGAYKPA